MIDIGRGCPSYRSSHARRLFRHRDDLVAGLPPSDHPGSRRGKVPDGGITMGDFLARLRTQIAQRAVIASECLLSAGSAPA